MTRQYKGYTITKIREGQYLIGGFMDVFKSWAEAKDAVDAADAEDKALVEAERYVQNVCGGWM